MGALLFSLFVHHYNKSCVPKRDASLSKNYKSANYNLFWEVFLLTVENFISRQYRFTGYFGIITSISLSFSKPVYCWYKIWTCTIHFVAFDLWIFVKDFCCALEHFECPMLGFFSCTVLLCEKLCIDHEYLFWLLWGLFFLQQVGKNCKAASMRVLKCHIFFKLLLYSTGISCKVLFQGLGTGAAPLFRLL